MLAATLPLAVGLTLGSGGRAGDQPQWGEAGSHNMVSAERGLPESFDPATGRNVKWSVELGTETHGTPVIAGGRVLIGANNGHPRDSRQQGDRGVLMCFDEKDGAFLWQLVAPKLSSDPYQDWPQAGIVSTPVVEGEHVYTMDNRVEVFCLDLQGQANGNGGPLTNEAALLAPRGTEPLPLTAKDADILWAFDVLAEAGTYPHDGAHGGFLIDGPFLYFNSCNGVDNTHKLIRKPEAPSLIVLDKRTGRWVARDEERIGPRIFHSTWSTPTLGVVAGRKLVFFGGGDGVVYAFEALAADAASPGAGGTHRVAALKKVWQFDCDPTGPKENVHRFNGNRREGPSNIKSIPVFHEGRVYVTVGGDLWWGKNQVWLKCIDAVGQGDITRTGQVWSYDLVGHSMSSPAIQDGLVFVGDSGHTFHCVEAATGKGLWTQEVEGEVWASPLVADGRVYLCTRRGALWVFAASREKKLLSRVALDSPVSASPIAANGVLYVATMTRLYALQQGATAAK